MVSAFEPLLRLASRRCRTASIITTTLGLSATEHLQKGDLVVWSGHPPDCSRRNFATRLGPQCHATRQGADNPTAKASPMTWHVHRLSIKYLLHRSRRCDFRPAADMAEPDRAMTVEAPVWS